jgi:hypothetical protein
MKVTGCKVGATGWVFEDFPLQLFEQQCVAVRCREAKELPC